MENSINMSSLNRRNFLKAGALGLSGCVAIPSIAKSSKTKNLNKAPENLTILFQGDSITDAGRDKARYYANDTSGMLKKASDSLDSSPTMLSVTKIEKLAQMMRTVLTNHSMPRAEAVERRFSPSGDPRSPFVEMLAVPTVLSINDKISGRWSANDSDKRVRKRTP